MLQNTPTAVIRESAQYSCGCSRGRMKTTEECQQLEECAICTKQHQAIPIANIVMVFIICNKASHKVSW